MVDVQPYLQRIVDQFENPDVQSNLEGFTRDVLFRFTDTHEDWLIKIVDGKEATIVQGGAANPDATITTTTEVLTGVMDRKVNAMSAYMLRKIQVKAPMEDLVMMQKLMF
jgi:putative sterol carrier protein